MYFARSLSHLRSRVTKLRYFVALAFMAVACASGLAHAAVTREASTPSRPGPAGNVYDLQSLGHDDSHTAYLNDPNMDVTIAPTLGVHWMTSLQAADVGSPTIAYNGTAGKTLVYAGNERGDMQAMDVVTGQPIWSTSVGVGDSIYSTPLITRDESSVWFGTAFGSAFYKLNAATGAIECGKPQPLAFQSSATEGQDANGNALVYISTIDDPSRPGPELAYKISDCRLVFSSNPYKIPNTGSWASASYGVDANGRPLIFVGTTDPANSEYALDATTGALDWYFVTIENRDYDIGAASTVSAPGVNGFADGVLYVVAKDNILYALDLTKGTLIWEYNFGQNALSRSSAAHTVRPVLHGLKPPRYPDAKGARSTAAFDGKTLVFGMASGVFAIDAVTGNKVWSYADPQKSEVISSPAIVGPPGKEVVAFATYSGSFQVLSLADGKLLYQYQTGGFVTASPAYYAGQFFLTSADGFVYDFAAGGGNGAAPETAILSPKPGVVVPNTGTVTISGTATDAKGIAAVEVAVQAGGPTGNWYDAANNSFNSTGAFTNRIAVAQSGSVAKTSVNWSITIPVPATGTTLQVYANAVNVAQLADVLGASDHFTVSAAASQPSINASSVFIAPGSSFISTGTGFNASEIVDFAVNSAIIGSVTAGKNGNIAATLTLPKASIFGVTPLTATGRTSKKSAFTPIDIANAWAQAAYAPEQTAFEPNDLVFGRTINPDYTFLRPAWYYQSGAAVESSPAVYDGIAFFGNDAGTLSAVDITTGAPIFRVTIPSGAAIRSTPAIDQKTGDLVFTADDGNLYLTTVAGTGLTTVSIGGLPTSPNVYNGTVYVGSDNGLLTAIDEATGQAIWSNTLSAAIDASPSVDTVTGQLVVGDAGGAIIAFDTALGQLTWTVMTNGAITAAPSIVSGVVYDGSADGNLYAIDEMTGTTKWTYNAQSPITIGSPYDPVASMLYVAGPNGKVTAVNAADGTVAWTSTAPGVTSAFVGASAVNAFYLAEDAQGSTITYRTSQFGRYESKLKTGSTLNTAPAISSGAVYVGASDGGLYAYTPYGHPPSIISPTIRRAEAALVAAQHHATWATLPRAPARFVWTGQRDVPLHVDATARTYRPTPVATAWRYHGGPVVSAPRRYVVFWQPAEVALQKRYIPAVAATLAARTAGNESRLAGTFLDTTPYPVQMSDAALQTEIRRAIVVNRWSTDDRNAQFILLTGPGAVPAGAGFCSYHSAFAFAHDRSKLLIYAVVPYAGTVSACGAPAGFNPSGDAAIDAVTVNLARVTHELANDPLLNGWYDANGGEIGPGFATAP